MIRQDTADVQSSLASFGKEWANLPAARALLSTLERTVLRMPALLSARDTLNAAEVAQGYWDTKIGAGLDPSLLVGLPGATIRPVDTRQFSPQEKFDWFFMPKTLKWTSSALRGGLSVTLPERRDLADSISWDLLLSAGNASLVLAQPGMTYASPWAERRDVPLLPVAIHLDQVVRVGQANTVVGDLNYLWIQGDLVFRPGYWR